MTAPVELDAQAAFGLADHQDQLRQTIRRFTAEHSNSADVRRIMESPEGYDRNDWQLLSGQLGLTGLIVPERCGGAGLTFVEQTIVLQELGASLFCSPYFSTVLATAAVLAQENEEAEAQLLPDIATGTSIATVACCEAGRWTVKSPTTQASSDGSRYRLDGRKEFVTDGAAATLLLVTAGSADGPGLFAVTRDAAGVTRRDQPALDQTRRLSTIDFDGTPAVRIDTAGAAGIERAFDFAGLALAAEQVGAARQCLEMSVEHGRTRVQFDRPIGSFQAIKHLLADTLLDVRFAESAVYYAAWAATERSPEFPALASMVKAHCSDVFNRAAATCIQVHGGMGYTWEHDAHLYYKRALSSRLLFGDAHHHRRRLAERIGLSAAG